MIKKLDGKMEIINKEIEAIKVNLMENIKLSIWYKYN